ncbi:MAG TPA: DUF2079 domain-containing protein [Candidatus Angelobacter sp.]|nr:DUF2079 domain-containing protein [Candidatus Angelobacter sp.]
MGTSVSVQNEVLAKGARGQSRFSWVGPAGIASLTSAWLWAAFVRGRGYSRPSQFLFLLIALAFAGGILWLAGRTIRRTSAGDNAHVLPYSLLAFLLLGIFLPEYLLGRPQPFIRSAALFGLAVALFVSYFAIAARDIAARDKEQPLDSLLSFLNLKPGAVVAVFCAIYFIATTFITISKLHAFGYVGQDIAYFTQCLYTALHGQLFYSNMYHDLLYGQPVSSDFAGHNQPVLAVFLPFYALHKSAVTLLIVRNLFVVLCAWPMYRIARRILSPWLAATATIAFMAVPAILYQNIYDFAPLSLAGFPLLWTVYFFLERRYWPFTIALLCMLMVREDLVFAVFGLGMLALWERRTLRWVALPSALALAWAFLSWKVIFPHFLHGTTSVVTGCFSYLGNGPGEMLRSMIHHPREVLSRQTLVYAKQAIDPFGGVLFLLNPGWLISIPYLAINILGQGGGCNTAMIYRHYSMIPTVLLFCSFLMSLETFSGMLRRKGGNPGAAQAFVVLFVLAASLASTVFVTGKEQADALDIQPWHEEARKVADLVPADASIAVPRYLLPYVANRSELYQSLRLLEYHNPNARYIVLDKNWGRMAATDQWKPNYYKLWQLLQSSPQYSMIYDSPNYVVYKLCEECTPSLPHLEPRPGANE